MKNKIVSAFLLFLGAMAISACAAVDYPVMSVAQANASAPRSYGLSPGDSVRITVFDEPTLTADYEVGSNGAIAFPLINEIDANGLSTAQLSEAIANELQVNGFVQQPRVSAEVLTYRPIYVLGEVQTPGEFEYTGDLTILQAIAKAGGFTPLADERRILLTRDGGDETVIVELGRTPLRILPGDTVVVRQSIF